MVSILVIPNIGLITTTATLNYTSLHKSQTDHIYRIIANRSNYFPTTQYFWEVVRRRIFFYEPMFNLCGKNQKQCLCNLILKY